MLSKRISGFSLVEICIAAVILLVVLLGASLFWRSSNIQTYHHELRLSFEEKWQRMTALLKQDLRSARHLDADHRRLEIGLVNLDQNSGNIDVATITWKIEDKGLFRQESDLKPAAIFVDPSTRLQLSLKFSRPQARSVKIEAGINDPEGGKMIFTREEIIGLPGLTDGETP